MGHDMNAEASLVVGSAAYLQPRQPAYPKRPAKGCDCGCGCDDGCGLERVRFFPRQLLGADDMNVEQHYFREKLRRHNRYLHGWGVVCGCDVKPAPTAEKPYQVLICPGYVVTPHGDEILIGCPALFDLATCIVSSEDPCAFSRPCPPVTSTMPLRSRIFLAVCYKECEVRPVRVAPVGCSCDDVACDYSRIRDAYEFECLDHPIATDDPLLSCDELCRGGIFPCPSCLPCNCVILATINLRTDYEPMPLPGSVDVAQLAASYMVATHAPLKIDTSDRKLLYSTTNIQQLAQCNCGGETHTVVQTVATPDITVVPSQSREQPVQVQMSVATPGATIHYTTDGTVPDSASKKYGGTISLPVSSFQAGATVRVLAYATAPGYNDSPVASEKVHRNPNP